MGDMTESKWAVHIAKARERRARRRFEKHTMELLNKHPLLEGLPPRSLYLYFIYRKEGKSMEDAMKRVGK